MKFFDGTGLERQWRERDRESPRRQREKKSERNILKQADGGRPTEATETTTERERERERERSMHTLGLGAQ